MVKGLVVVLKHKDSNTPQLGIVKEIHDGVNPRPSFMIDVIFGSADEPTFFHTYNSDLYAKSILKV
jgi:hypothetical protein